MKRNPSSTARGVGNNSNPLHINNNKRTPSSSAARPSGAAPARSASSARSSASKMNSATTYEEYMALHKKAKVPVNPNTYDEEESDEMLYKARGPTSAAEGRAKERAPGTPTEQRRFMSSSSGAEPHLIGSAPQPSPAGPFRSNPPTQQFPTPPRIQLGTATAGKGETTRPLPRVTGPQTSARSEAFASVIRKQQQEGARETNNSNLSGSHAIGSTKAKAAAGNATIIHVSQPSASPALPSPPPAPSPPPRHVLALRMVFGNLLSAHTNASLCHLKVRRVPYERDATATPFLSGEGFGGDVSDDDDDEGDTSEAALVGSANTKDDVEILCEIFLGLNQQIGREIDDELAALALMSLGNFSPTEYQRRSSAVGNRGGSSKQHHCIHRNLWRTLHDLTFHFVRISEELNKDSSNNECEAKESLSRSNCCSLRDTFWAERDTLAAAKGGDSSSDQKRQSNSGNSSLQQRISSSSAPTEWYFVIKCLAEANYPRIAYLAQPRHNTSFQIKTTPTNNSTPPLPSLISVASVAEGCAEVILAILWLLFKGVDGFGSPQPQRRWWFEELAAQCGRPLASFAGLLNLRFEEEEEEEADSGHPSLLSPKANIPSHGPASDLLNQMAAGSCNKQPPPSALNLLEGISLWPPQPSTIATSLEMRTKLLKSMLGAPTTTTAAISSTSTPSVHPTATHTAGRPLSPHALTCLLRAANGALNKVETLLHRRADVLQQMKSHSPSDYVLAACGGLEGLETAASAGVSINKDTVRNQPRTLTAEAAEGRQSFPAFEARLSKLRALVEEELSFMRMLIPSSSRQQRANGVSGQAPTHEREAPRRCDPRRYAESVPCVWERHLLECIRFVSSHATNTAGELAEGPGSVRQAGRNVAKKNAGAHKHGLLTDCENALVDFSGFAGEFSSLKQTAGSTWAHLLRSRVQPAEMRALQRAVSVITSTSNENADGSRDYEGATCHRSRHKSSHADSARQRILSSLATGLSPSISRLITNNTAASLLTFHGLCGAGEATVRSDVDFLSDSLQIGLRSGAAISTLNGRNSPAPAERVSLTTEASAIRITHRSPVMLSSTGVIPAGRMTCAEMEAARIHSCKFSETLHQMSFNTTLGSAQSLPQLVVATLKRDFEP